jgi:hypothetical protein
MKRKTFLIVGLFFVVISLYAQTKTTTSRNIYRFTYIEFNDGCLVSSGNYHYREGSYSTSVRGGTKQIRPPEHRNDNSIVRSEINRFNSEIRRLNAVTEDDQQAILKKTPIGSWYFVYRINQKYDIRDYFSRVNEGIPRSETCVIYSLNIWRVDVVRGR